LQKKDPFTRRRSFAAAFFCTGFKSRLAALVLAVTFPIFKYSLLIFDDGVCTPKNEAMSESSKETASSTSHPSAPLSREEKFKALRSKLAASTKANHAEVIAEHKRMKIDPASLSKLDHKKADAELKLAKQDAEEAGDDFERKRAWDWTMEESEKWDRRLAQKAQNRDAAAFAGSPLHVPVRESTRLTYV